MSSMLKRVCLAILLLLPLSSQARAAEILAVLSSPAEPYLVARTAFEQHFNSMAPGRGLKTIQPHIIRSVILRQNDDNNPLNTAVAEQRPDLIVALGSRALAQSTRLPDKIPVIYLLVPSPERILPADHQATGVLLQPRPGAEFRALHDLLPTLQRVGVVYNPAHSGDLIMATMANSNNFTFELRPIKRSQEVADQLAELAGRVDLVWMPPDQTILAPQAEKSFYIFSLQHKIPLLAFSEKYLRRGASLAVTLDIDGMSRKAAGLAQLIQSGARPAHITPLVMERAQLRQNSLILNKLMPIRPEVAP